MRNTNEKKVSTVHHELMNSLDPDIKLIFKNVSTIAIFLDVSCSTKIDQLMFDIYHEPTHSFSHLH